MIFSEGSIGKIIDGSKVQTRRLVKEEFYAEMGSEDHKPIVYSSNRKGRTKYQVGKTYAVQPGRGKKGIHKCIHCNSLALAGSDNGWLELDGTPKMYSAEHNYHPLRIRITEIRKENLFEISEEDARKEGFSNTDDFIMAFAKLNNIKRPKLGVSENKYGFPDGIDVWVLDFEVVE